MPTVEIHTTTDETLDPDSKCKDRASLSRALAAHLGVEKHDHVRVDVGRYATYYRVHRVHEDPSRPMVVYETSLERFAGADGDIVELSTTLPKESRETARNKGGLSESVIDDGSQDAVLVTAPHAGSIESGTGTVARWAWQLLREAGVPASLWTLDGYRVPGQDISSFRVWHVGKPMRAVSAYPGLGRLVDREFDVVVGFHRSGYDQIEVGGRTDDHIRERVAEELRERTGKTVWTDLDRLRLPGTHPDVSVNYLADDGGLHLECTPGTCKNYQRKAARAVVSVVRETV